MVGAGKLYMNLLEKRNKKKIRKKSKFKLAATSGIDAFSDMLLLMKNHCIFFVMVLFCIILSIIKVVQVVLPLVIVVCISGICQLFKFLIFTSKYIKNGSALFIQCTRLLCLSLPL